MKKFLSFYITLLFSTVCIAQNKLTIIYGTCTNLSDTIAFSDSIDYKMMLDRYLLYSEYTINDSTDFFDFIHLDNLFKDINIEKEKEKRKNLVLGDVLGTSSYRYSNNYKTGIKYEQVTIIKEYKKITDNKSYKRAINYVLIDSIKHRIKKWTLTDKRKKILGYECKQALLFNESELLKSVWYTTELNCNFSAGDDLGLDGVILETYFPQSKSFSSAIDIEKNARPIIYPKYKKRDLLDKKQFDKIREY